MISSVTFISARRGVTSQARAAAIRKVEGEITELNRKLEGEVTKLQRGLDQCIKDRIGLKGELQILRNALKIAHDQIKELQEKASGREEQEG